MKKILIKFPSRERPDKFRDCISNILSTISDKKNVHILGTLDENDESMKFASGLRKYFDISVVFGNSENKIHAVNRDMDLTNFEWDYLVLMSDDMRFISTHWDKHIISDFRDSRYPVILHYPTDRFHGDRIITMPIINRKFYDYFGYIYHPSYKSLYCDDEQTEVAKQLGFYRKMYRQIAIHDHPIYTGEKFDSLMEKNQNLSDEDYINFQKRKSINFEL